MENIIVEKKNKKNNLTQNYSKTRNKAMRSQFTWFQSKNNKFRVNFFDQEP